ncbi:hypothetical protein [Aliarcobacter butzleri]|uniref:hypothetical protein n=1 Tax=Aliarcobacter butzleri TaxID=28197 RepID=UPI00215B3534|nr:hypothetical protein [Aliarcobacter butzleri]MCR8711003.1 hypothetical protein [Aliarcobacter butzleri]
MIIKAIKTPEDYKITLKRIDQLMESIPNTPEFDELEILVTLVENYEEKTILLISEDKSTQSDDIKKQMKF